MTNIRNRGKKKACKGHARGTQRATKKEGIKNEKEEEESLSSNNQVPHQAIIGLYHQILPEWPVVKIWSEKRQGLLRARWRDDLKRQSLDWWKGLFEYVRRSEFLMDNTDRKWRPNLEWLLTESKFINLLEGKYHDE